DLEPLRVLFEPLDQVAEDVDRSRLDDLDGDPHVATLVRFEHVEQRALRARSPVMMIGLRTRHIADPRVTHRDRIDLPLKNEARSRALNPTRHLPPPERRSATSRRSPKYPNQCF